MHRFLTRFSAAFPLWIVLGCVWAWLQPSAWTWFAPFIQAGLGVIMLGMGLTLRFSDFMAVARQPRAIAIGIGLQFFIMPTTAWVVARTFGLEPGLAIGLILVGCCPGGTASNVICYLARADVPLSVLLTLTSTTAAIVATPLLTNWLAGAWLPVDPLALFQSMIQVVLIPLTVGIAIHTAFTKRRTAASFHRWMGAIGPLVSVLLIVLVVSCIVGQKKPEIAAAAAPLFLSVFLLHLSGFLFGYLLAWLLGCRETLRRTISIEVGMQNSGLGASLATTHFAQYVLAPVPAALSAVYHCLIGSLLAACWRRRAPKE